MMNFKFLTNNVDPYSREVNPNYYRRVTITIPPAGLSHYQWNILPQDLKDEAEGGNFTNMMLYIQGWEASRRGDAANPYDNQHFAYRWDRGFTDHQMRVANPPRTRECAVIASSVRDFNHWREGLFNRSSVFIITNRDFTHTNGNNNQTTEYIAITTINDCQGLMFDDCVRTNRISEILMSGNEDTINHIQELRDEVRLHIR